MRAIRYHQFGTPTDVLVLDDLPMPEPGPGQVRVRYTHRPINPSDLLTAAGLYGVLPPPPAVAGWEGMGRVDKLGEGVTGIAEGQRVVPLNVQGTWTEYALARASNLIPVPDAVSDESAAQFIINPVSVWAMLDVLGLQAGDWLLQSAAGSAVGRLTIQLAKQRGIRTVNLVRRAEQVQELLDLGGDEAFATDTPDLVARIRELTGGKGATGAIDAVGGDTGALMLSALRPGGTMLVYGLLSGQPTPVNGGEMLFRGTGMRGFWLVQWFQTTPPEQVAASLNGLMSLMAQGDLTPPLEATYDLADYQKAIAHAERPGRSGKVLLIG